MIYSHAYLKTELYFWGIIEDIKDQIRSAQHRAILNANKEMLILYWNIGKIINENSTWGSKFLNKLSNEISSEFPSAKGFSVRNLKNMARFYREYPKIEIVQSVTAQITWTHNIEILRVESKEQRLWYINKTIENGWSVNVLAHQIDTNLYARQIEQKKVSNFPTILPSSQSELALETMKDPYVFDFIELKEDAQEKDLEEALIKNITKVLLEFGKGFSVDNLENMRRFYLIYSNSETLSRNLAFTLSWSHYLKLMRIDNPEEHKFYEIEAKENNWNNRYKSIRAM